MSWNPQQNNSGTLDTLASARAAIESDLGRPLSQQEATTLGQQMQGGSGDFNLPVVRPALPSTPAASILAGARNAPVIKILPSDMAGVPDPVRRALPEGGNEQGAFFPAETPDLKRQRLELEAQGATGFYTPAQNEVWIKSGLSPSDEKFAAYHEVAGHYGLEGSLGENYGDVMAKAAQNPTVQKLANAMRSGAAAYSQDDQQRATEEALSDLAAANRTGNYTKVQQDWGVRIPMAERSGFSGWLGRVVDRTKQVLSALTGHHPSAFTDAQVHSMLEGAWRYVRNPPPAQGDGSQ